MKSLNLVGWAVPTMPVDDAKTSFASLSTAFMLGKRRASSRNMPTY